MKRTFDVLVAGGGMAGLTVAALLAQSEQRERLNIRVADARPRPRFDANAGVSLRVSAIAVGSMRLFDSLGAWERVQAVRACPFRGMRVWDADGSVDAPGALRFDAAEFAVAELGCIVENALLQDALLAVLDAAVVELSFDTPIRSLSAVDDRFEVTFEDGTTARPEVLIGADGAASLVRAQARIGSFARHYGQAAFVTHLQPERPHGHAAWQRFLPEGPLALLPLADGRVSTVWSTTPAAAEAALALPEEALGELLSEKSDRVLGALTPAGPRGSFPLRAQHAARYARAGMALVGDAAHSIHPLAGQGANLGIADAEALAGTICAAIADGEYPGDLPVLRRYERSRKGANAAMLNFVDTLNRLFTARSTPVSILRRTGMTLFNHSGPVRRRAVEAALGINVHPGR
ncbi:MAG TPA: FAD-dependent monooxygenase [Woeseiaceae bacterium]|nr:FAD-dependent monooxygenase [Woeseiaceae bacterium]